MPIISVQSHVAYGRVGNRAAVFALERLGHETWPVNTVSFSNHPAYGSHKGGLYQSANIAEIFGEIERRRGFPDCAALLSGYLGSAATGRVVLDAVKRIRAANPRMFFALDPVMGDRPRGLYVAAELPAFFRDEALPLADIVLPNLFELEQLSGSAVADEAAAIAAARSLLKRGVEMVVVTGLRRGSMAGALLVTGQGAWRAAAPWVEVPAYGAGDLFGALFLGHYLGGADAPLALARSVWALHRVLAATQRLGLPYLALVAAQDELAAAGAPIAAERAVAGP
jgi:pyridoxine kinase